jgi:hypothetical protein
LLRNVVIDHFASLACGSWNRIWLPRKELTVLPKHRIMKAFSSEAISSAGTKPVFKTDGLAVLLEICVAFNPEHIK